MDDAILFSVEGPCANITLNRPQRGNALTPELQGTFLRYLAQAADDDLIHYVVLRAKGKYFCTGMDLSSSGGSIGGDSTETYVKARAFFETLERFPKPIISVANGPCMGGGCGIFFLADIRLASRETSFSLTEVLRGLVPALISPTIIREWGTSLAREAMLTARPVSAVELHARGAISVLFEGAEEGERELTAMLQRLKKGGPKALQNVKRLVRTQTPAGLALLPPHDLASTQAEQSIKAAFIEMMGPSEEALQGIMTFRTSKGKKDVDWYTFYKSKL